jgi:mannose-6-phosphate isomerase-like protein (cupin superfamily)
MKDVFVKNIENLTLKNSNFRKVLFTAKHMQLVLMSIKVGTDIGMETHKHTDQFIRIESGVGMAILDGKKYKLTDGSAVVIPAGTKHNIINISKTEPLKLYTIYTPPEHKPNTIQKNKPLHDDH